MPFSHSRCHCSGPVQSVSLGTEPLNGTISRLLSIAPVYIVSIQMSKETMDLRLIFYPPTCRITPTSADDEAPMEVVTHR